MARYYNNGNYYWYLADYLSLPPIHLCFFVGILFTVLGFSWYINYESMWEDTVNQAKLFLMACPVVLLLIVHLMSSVEDRRRVPFFLSLPQERDSLHRAGGSPWGVAAILGLLILMVSYHSSLQERWFPLLSR